MLGISIYPQYQSTSELKEYIKEAYQNGYKKIFTSLIEVKEQNMNKMIAKFVEIILFARKLDFEVVLDVNPTIFEVLNISYDDLSFFANLHCSGIRLDDVMNAKTIADMTHNKYDLDIEINCSNSKYLINEIMEFAPVKRKLIACHNFYPQKLSGLDFDYFINVTKNYKKHNIRVGAFVSANPHNATFGPTKINDGICTIESHRNLPIHTQAKLLMATNLIDDVIIGNSRASTIELVKLANTNYDIIELDVEINANTTNLEREIILTFEHYRRGDITSYMVRSTMSRVVYANEEFFEHDNLAKMNLGDIIICNNKLGHYKGELHLILKTLDVDQRKNKVAKICDYDLELIKYITP